MGTHLNKDQIELVHYIDNSANILLKLIENVLDISKVESGCLEIKKEPIDLYGIITSVTNMVSLLQSDKGLLITYNIDPNTPFSLVGSEVQLRQILINLMANAIKFTEEGYVNLNVFPSHTSFSKVWIRFEVIDSGIGMDIEAQGKIFDNFTQADSGSSRGYGGSGLGTTISKGLVELMGGNIGVQSNPGEGSKFWFEIPFDILSGSEITLSNDLKILVVASRETETNLKTLFNEWGLEYKHTESSMRALTALSEQAEQGDGYHVVIVDQSIMQAQNPQQFASFLKNDPDLKNLSLILINSSDSMVNANLINQYYISVIHNSDDLTLLFNSIHIAQSMQMGNDEITIPNTSDNTISNLNILFAEDNAINRQVINKVLMNARHNPTLARDGEEALAIIDDDLETFDIIILDMNMPKKSGVDVLKVLRVYDTSASTPVIMLTADATLETKNICMRAGANAYLTKPINAKKLLENIYSLVKDSPRYRSKLQERVLENIDTKIVHIFPEKWIDTEKVAELFELGGGKDFFFDLIKVFESDGNNLIDALFSSLDDDYTLYRDNLHALKGSAYDIGAVALGDFCAECVNIKQHHLGSDKIKAQTEKLNTYFISSIRELKKF
jgi:two-component system sensor histidine kinase RpfC